MAEHRSAPLAGKRVPARLPWVLAALLLCLGQTQPGWAEVRIVKAQPSTRAVTLSGFTRARAEMAVISEAAGRCLSVAGDVGDALGKDGVFARLDDTFIRLELESNAIAQDRVKSKAAYLEKEAKRYRALVAKKSEAQAKLDKLEEDLAQARLELKALANAREVLAERRARHAVKAPAGWLIVERRVETGMWVATGKTIGVVGDYRTLLLPLALSPDEYQALKVLGGKVGLSAPDWNKKLEATVERVDPSFDPKTRKINLDLLVKAGLPEMRGGLRLELELPLPDPAGAVLVPREALVTRYQENWLTRPDGSEVRVILLGDGPEGLVRVSSKEVKVGDEFKLE